MRGKNSGVFLVDLMIVVILISVAATAYLNFRSGQHEPLPQIQEVTAQNGFIQAALGEIGYHISFARRGTGHEVAEPLIIENGAESDRIVVFHGNAKYEYFVDQDNDLIRRREGKDTVMADGVGSLRVTRVGGQTLVVTISTNLRDDQGLSPETRVSRSFSTVVATNGISQGSILAETH
ncbi:MAG: hypothetical protein A2W25_02835 [candidate division Zixibacteria bacterium RBG_16_53_22]|nr:MAG: hypothetical protein A2W25_02835 [candidate division Zixibacteria bacterium RBG_16_53_22]